MNELALGCIHQGLQKIETEQQYAANILKPCHISAPYTTYLLRLAWDLLGSFLFHVEPCAEGRPPSLGIECKLISTHTMTQSRRPQNSLLCSSSPPTSQWEALASLSSESESHHSFEGLTSLACFHATRPLIAQLKRPLVVLVKHAWTHKTESEAHVWKLSLLFYHITNKINFKK